jgi:hypothetical protein
MSEHTDATEDRPDDESPPDAADEDGAEEQPQPWAKASSGDDD